MTPNDAKKMRTALRQIPDSAHEPVTQVVIADDFEVHSSMSDSPRDKVSLVLFKEGTPIARLMIDAGSLKKIGRQMKWWRSAKSGALLQSRHGNFGVGAG